LKRDWDVSANLAEFEMSFHFGSHPGRSFGHKMGEKRAEAVVVEGREAAWKWCSAP